MHQPIWNATGDAHVEGGVERVGVRLVGLRRRRMGHRDKRKSIYLIDGVAIGLRSELWLAGSTWREGRDVSSMGAGNGEQGIWKLEVNIPDWPAS